MDSFASWGTGRYRGTCFNILGSRVLPNTPNLGLHLWQHHEVSWSIMKYHEVSWSTSSTSSTAQGGGGSFKNRKPIGEVGCCESGMAERSHWWTERCLRSPLFLSLSLFFSLFLYLSLIIYLPTYRSICLLIYLSVCLSIHPSIHLSICLAIYQSIYLSV